MIIGVDYHPSVQQIAFLIEETGEYDEQRLNHEGGEAERFYRDLKRKGIRVRVGMEATGYSRWFERLLAELDFELWIGDPAEIEAKRVKKRKTDREDAKLLLRLMRVYERAVVVEAEFNGTNKTTLRSEWGSVPEKRKERTKNSKKRLDTSRHC